MATRIAYAPTTEVLTSTNLAKLAGGWIGYVEATTNQTAFGPADTDLTSLSVTVTVGTSRRIRVSCNTVFLAAAGGRLHVNINEGATVLQHTETDQATGGYANHNASVVLTPTAGSHTYKLQAGGSFGTSLTLSASATGPAFLLVEDIGAAT